MLRKMLRSRIVQASQDCFVVPPRKFVLRMGVMGLDVLPTKQLAQQSLRVSKIIARLHKKT